MINASNLGYNFACWLLFLVVSGSAMAADSANETVELSKRAVAILRRECNSCHGPDKQEASLRLDTSVPKPALLLQRIEHTDPELLMPPKRRLGESDLAILKAWVQAGAPRPVEE